MKSDCPAQGLPECFRESPGLDAAADSAIQAAGGSHRPASSKWSIEYILIDVSYTCQYYIVQYLMYTVLYGVNSAKGCNRIVSRNWKPALGILWLRVHVRRPSTLEIPYNIYNMHRISYGNVI